MDSNSLHMLRSVESPNYFLEAMVPLVWPTHVPWPKQHKLIEQLHEINLGYHLIHVGRGEGSSHAVQMYLLWRFIFRNDQSDILLSSNAPMAIDSLGRIRDVYRGLYNLHPEPILPLIMKSSSQLSTITNRLRAHTTSETYIRGRIMNYLVIDNGKVSDKVIDVLSPYGRSIPVVNIVR